MKKIFLIILLTLFYGNIYSQNYKVKYEVKLLEEEEFLKNENTRSIYLSAVEGASLLKFNLICNDTVSRFILEDFLEKDSYSTKAAIILTELKKKLFIISENVYYNNNEWLFNEETYIIEEKTNKNWSISTETKKINNYTCYKATTEYVVTNPKGTFKHPVVAWFCPEIPISHGPNGYGGLPGLILEIQIRKTLLGAIKIEKTEEKIQYDLKGEKITKDELEKKYIDFRNSNKD